MPTGVYVRTEKCKMALSIASKLNIHKKWQCQKGVQHSISTQFKKGHQAFKNKHHSEETRKILSLQRIGIKTNRIPISAFKKGQIPWNKGITTNYGWKISKSNKGKKAWNRGIPSKYRGISRPKYVCEKIKKSLTGKKLSNEHRKTLSISHGGNGISRTPYPTNWNENLKSNIRNRDNNKCQICGTPQSECTRKLYVHHIDYNKNNLSLKNLITLCDRCHASTNKMNKRNYYMNMFSQKIEERYAKIHGI